MSFNESVEENALVASGRHCCLCHLFCGIKIELHHIIQAKDKGEDTFENCIPLCFNCHADMRSYDSQHPKGTKYSPAELIRHRDNWYSKVKDGTVTLNTEHTQKLDASVYLRIKAMLPWNGPIRFAKKFDFSVGSFRDTPLHSFYKFLEECEDPSFEFIDPDLESLRATLREKIAVFSKEIGNNTWVAHHNDQMQTVPPEWVEEDPDRYEEVVTLLSFRPGTRVFGKPRGEQVGER